MRFPYKFFFCELVLLLVMPSAWGRTATSSLRGTVTDPQGAVVTAAS